jgi:two-component system, NtrC family, response regulator HydG
MESPRILIVDDDKDVLLALALLLRRSGYEAVPVDSPERIAGLMAEGAFDAVFLDMNFTRGATAGEEGIRRLKEIVAADPEAMVIPITAYGDIDLAVRAVKEGAADFVLKPWDNEKLLGTLDMALKLRRSRLEVALLKSQRMQLELDAGQRRGEILGESPAMERVFALIRKVAATDANVLVTGENGTGKELVARELHARSARSGEAFIGVDIASIPETLFESELFGHARGAFTDAKDSRMGRFESASGGTLFLDEIGNLTMPMQAKLLRAIESREVTPVGSDRPRPVDVRLICATNAPVREMAARREFREDLLYRIDTVEIALPPLRERGRDVLLLAERFAAAYSRKYRLPPRRITPEAAAALLAYRWPGNVRELRHAIERAVIVGDSEELAPGDFAMSSRAADPPGPPVKPSGRALSSLERDAIERCLERQGGNISRAAEELGLSRASLYRRIRKYGLQEYPA